MTLQDLRRYAVRNRCRIRFTVEASGECLVDEHGLLRIPALQTTTAVNVGELLGSVDRFVLEPAVENPRRQTVSRQELQGLVGEAPAASHPGDE
jgi:hypothetical protein